jgi:hypothetical protein
MSFLRLFHPEIGGGKPTSHLANFGTGAGASTIDGPGLREESDGPAKDDGGNPKRLSGTRGVVKRNTTLY